MFHIPISGHKYWCAKYTFCFILIGEQRLRKYEDTRDPPPPEEGEQRSQPEDVEEGEVVEITPQQVMFRLWYQNRVISPMTVHNGLSRKSYFEHEIGD
ncbi:hypothetical protein AB205_0177410 [Aquarana catesbeiana]|uniref:Uncharacterized protein n=1 Tax=Aquarana catesbeiana TaxID=8400 RepID=A0A2G9RED3_AQUCT|nr:hypothetical protein AB205_0177410 [Aquarana catesbeiana]